MGLADFAHMASQMSGVSLRARRGTTQVMLGGSLRTRWDTGQVGHNSSLYNDQVMTLDWLFDEKPSDVTV